MATTDTTKRGVRKRRSGVVVSDAMDKTIVVLIETKSHHPLYGKMIRSTSKFHAHDEKNEAKKGDLVAIVETRPVSRKKRWRLVEITRRSPAQD